MKRYYTSGYMAKIFSSKRRLWLILGVSLGTALIAGAGFFFGYYRGHALPGVSVAGVPVSGMTPQQVQATLAERADGQTITLEIPGEDDQSVPLADTGVFVDVGATTELVFEANQSPLTMVKGFFGDHEVVPVTTADTKHCGGCGVSVVTS